MRLSNMNSLQLREFFDSDIPEYAILSHKWGAEEVSYQDFLSGRNKEGTGYEEILNCCSLARKEGYSWVWIDACCIDKSSSAELSEAINSMYRWYQFSQICYAYLSDFEKINGEDDSVQRFRSSVWFARGWTLQELIAPKKLNFLDRHWNLVGSRRDLSHDIALATRIHSIYLNELHIFTKPSVATIMSWASCRQTSRVEDMAYCLMGCFRVNMPLLYGEGEKAFLRLQSEIIKISDDESIFAWKAEKNNSGLLADWPSAFKEPGDIIPRMIGIKQDSPPYVMTNKGLKFKVPASLVQDKEVLRLRLNCCERTQKYALAVDLKQLSTGNWTRVNTSSLSQVPWTEVWDRRTLSSGNKETIYIPQDTRMPFSDQLSHLTALQFWPIPLSKSAVLS